MRDESPYNSRTVPAELDVNHPGIIILGKKGNFFNYPQSLSEDKSSGVCVDDS